MQIPDSEIELQASKVLLSAAILFPSECKDNWQSNSKLSDI